MELFQFIWIITVRYLLQGRQFIQRGELTVSYIPKLLNQHIKAPFSSFYLPVLHPNFSDIFESFQVLNSEAFA